jgi:hypothetical protein
MSFHGQTAEPIEPVGGTGVDPLAFAASRPKPGTRSGAELHVCPGCGSELVYPIDWAPADERNWALDLRCPDCERIGNGVYGQDVVARFDIELDRGTEMLIEDLARLTRATMDEEIERFISALHADHILVEDF